jgi:UMF1 family MFS transporter
VTAEPVRATFLLAAAWYAFFCIPLFLFIPDSPPKNKSLSQSIKAGFGQLGATFKQIRRYRSIAYFLIAKMLYVDGLATLFAFGGIYAASIFGMDDKQVLLFGIALNLSAGLGAIALACLDDKVGSKRMIMFSLAALIVLGSLAVVAVHAWQFWTVGILLGIFVGPVQSSSRSLMEHKAPKHLRNQMFGFYMFSGKATAFLGPLLYGWAVFLSDSLRWGMATVILLFILGGLLMFMVSDKEAEETPAS